MAIANEVEVKSGGSKALTIRQQLMSPGNLAELAKALPAHIKPEHMARVMLTAINVTPKLQSCDPLSILGCLMSCAQLGLEPDPILGHVYIIPYGNQATLQIGYKGLIELVMNTGLVSKVWSRLVHRRDAFQIIEGTNPSIHHIPVTDSTEAGDVIGAYAVIQYKDGTLDFEFMDEAQIQHVKSRSKSSSGPWSTDPDEMRRKCPIRRLMKRIKVSREDRTKVTVAATEDELRERGLLVEGKNGYKLISQGEADAPAGPRRLSAAKTEPIEAELVNEETGEVIEREPGDDTPTDSQPAESTITKEKREFDERMAASGNDIKEPKANAISEPQAKRMYAIAKNQGWSDDELKALIGKHGFKHTREVTKDKYDAICKVLEEGERN